MTLPAKMRALGDKVPGFFWSDSDFGSFALLYILRFEIQLVHLYTVRDIDAVHHQHNRFAFFECDHIWFVGESLHGDFDSPGRLGTARVADREQRYSRKEHY